MYKCPHGPKSTARKIASRGLCGAKRLSPSTTPSETTRATKTNAPAGLFGSISLCTHIVHKRQQRHACRIRAQSTVAHAGCVKTMGAEQFQLKLIPPALRPHGQKNAVARVSSHQASQGSGGGWIGDDPETFSEQAVQLIFDEHLQLLVNRDL